MKFRRFRDRSRRLQPGGVFAGAILCMAAQGPALAQPRDLTELPLEQLMNVEVYGASKFMQKSSEAPAAVTVITATDIRTYGYRTLGDALRTVPGMYVNYDRQYQYLGVRGFARPGDYNTRLLVLLDGYKMNDNIYDSGMIGTEFILDLDLVERIEVIRGPGSPIYGSNALFGVVNLVTRRPEAGQTGEVAAEAGSYGTWGGRATLSRLFENGAALTLSASGGRSDGPDLVFPDLNPPLPNGGFTSGTVHQDLARLYGRLAAGPLALTAAYASRAKGIPTGYAGVVFNTPANEVTDEQTFVDLAWQARASTLGDLTARIYYGSYRYSGDYLYDWPQVVVNRDEAKGQWWGAEVKVLKEFGNHKLIAGVEYQDNRQQDQMNYDRDPVACLAVPAPAPCLDDRRASARAGVYLQDQVTLTEQWLLNAGLRYEKVTDQTGQLNPRLAIIRKLDRGAVKLLYGSAFRAPNVYESFYAFPGAAPQLPLA